MTDPFSRTKDPFAYQAARAALWSPVIALGLGACTQSLMQESTSSAIVIASVNCLLILAGFIFSIIALIGVFIYGPSRLLLRGIIGFLFSGALTFFILTFVLFGNPLIRHLEKRLTGKWEYHSPTSSTDDLTLNPDKSFDLTISDPHGSITGEWRIARNRDDKEYYLVLQAHSATGGLISNASAKVGMKIDKTDDNQITLSEAGQPKTYQRLP